MPQSTPERRARWGIDDAAAMKYLRQQGFNLHADWCWTHIDGREPDAKEADAIIFLIEEWDMGGWCETNTAHIMVPGKKAP